MKEIMRTKRRKLSWLTSHAERSLTLAKNDAASYKTPWERSRI
jgi:hypothetical protein